MIHELKVDDAAKDLRLDVWLEQQLPGCSRSLVAKQIKSGHCTMSSGKLKPSWRLRGDEQITIEVPEMELPDISPEDIPIDILYEDNDLLVVNKTAGMVVHPAIGHPRGTLLNALLFYAKEEWQPRLIHRLDADTSGIILIAKNAGMHEAMQDLFKQRSINKRYLAICHGSPKADYLECYAWIGRHPKDFRKRFAYPAEHPRAKEAHSDFRVRERHQDYVVIEAKIYTGRTHQIRVHLKELGHPILADGVYGRQAYWPLQEDAQPRIERQALHAWFISFDDPRDQKRRQFKAKIPSDLQVWLQNEIEPLDPEHA